MVTLSDIRNHILRWKYERALASVRKSIQGKYHIIPIGTYCLPRCITTFSKLKPTKREGEKSTPFDLAFFNNIDSIAQLVASHFEHFFDGLRYASNTRIWVNDRLSAKFVHDGNLDKQEFIKRYTARIENFYATMADREKHHFFLFASFKKVTAQQMNTLCTVLEKQNPAQNFTIIFINQTGEHTTYCHPRLETINLDYRQTWFNDINQSGKWVDELKKRRSLSAIRFYYLISIRIAQIVRKHTR